MLWVLRNDPISPSPLPLFLDIVTSRYLGVMSFPASSSLNKARSCGSDASGCQGTLSATHALKSSSAMIGAQTLPDFVKDLEPMGRQDKVSRSQMKIAGLGAL